MELRLCWSVQCSNIGFWTDLINLTHSQFAAAKGIATPEMKASIIVLYEAFWENSHLKKVFQVLGWGGEQPFVTVQRIKNSLFAGDLLR